MSHITFPKEQSHCFSCFLLRVAWISAKNAYGMSKPEPDCKTFGPLPQQGAVDVHLVNSSGSLSYVTRQERNAAAIAAMMRWNQQSESAVSFVYQGSVSESQYNNNKCDYNVVTTHNICSSGRAYFSPQCAQKKWQIVLCDSTLDPNGIPRSNDYDVGKILEDYTDVLSVLVHEFGHAQGLTHPASNDPNSFDEYCDGNAAVLGGSYCNGYSMHEMSRRDLYRYDNYCAFQRNSLRKLKLKSILSFGPVMQSNSYGIGGGLSNAAIWQDNSSNKNYLDTRTPSNRFYREHRQFPGEPSFHDSWQEDESLRTGQTFTIGMPASSHETRSGIKNDDENDEWLQRYYAAWTEQYPYFTSMGFVDWITATRCITTSCLNRVAIRSLYPIELVHNVKDDTTYGMWVLHDRENRNNAYKVNIAEYVGNGSTPLFAENLLNSSNVQFQTTIKPTLHCGARSSSSANTCVLFYVPLTDRLNRLHSISLSRTGNGFEALSNPNPTMTTIDGATYSIGSTLTSWKFPSDIFNSTSDYDVYVAFASSGPGFPLTILKFDANGQNGQKVGEWSTAISSPTVSPATESSAFTYLIWLGP